MAERLAHDIARDLREPGPWPSARLLCEAADKLEGLIELLAKAETERDQALARVARLRSVLADVLRGFYEKGHPGYPAMRSAWINVDQIKQWHEEINHD